MTENYNLEQLFAAPPTLLERWNKRLNRNDVVLLAKSLEKCISKDWKVLARWYFDFDPGSIENISSDNKGRAIQIQCLVQKWCEIKQNSATPEKVRSMLVDASLRSILQIWFSEYQDEGVKIRIQSCISEREAFMKNLVQRHDISNEEWTKFCIELGMRKELLTKNDAQRQDKLQERLKLLDIWTEKEGYVAASKETLISTLEKAGLAKEYISDNQSQNCVSNKHQKCISFPEEFDVGLLHGDTEADNSIVKRISEKLNTLGYKVHSFHKCVFVGGIEKAKKPEFFLDRSFCVMFVATESSLNSEGYANFNLCVTTNTSITKETEIGVRKFIVLIPEECKGIKLPSYLEAYTPLEEDEQFDERVEATMKRLRYKRSQFLKQ